MSRTEPDTSQNVATSTLDHERQRLIRLCGYLSGDVTVAEDLAQETLLEAHRSADKLRNPAARQAWLSGIARNICRRWARTRGRELSLVASQIDERGAGITATLDVITDEETLRPLAMYKNGVLLARA